jgi:hypothetical protein
MRIRNRGSTAPKAFTVLFGFVMTIFGPFVARIRGAGNTSGALEVAAARSSVAASANYMHPLDDGPEITIIAKTTSAMRCSTRRRPAFDRPTITMRDIRDHHMNATETIVAHDRCGARARSGNGAFISADSINDSTSSAARLGGALAVLSGAHAHAGRAATW